MSESRKNHLTIDGAQLKEDDKEHIGSYKPLPRGDGDFRKTPSHKSLEKSSPDGASERLLEDSDHAKITSKDMTDAKFVVGGDHRNGDAMVEIDANKKQFSGLTKEELLRYQDDPFWVRLRWTLFILFWLLWLCMLAGAIAIIFMTPKCTAPRASYAINPQVDMTNYEYSDIEDRLPILNASKVSGVYVKGVSYPVLQETDNAIESFKKLLEKAKKYGIRLIVELIPNYVSIDSQWFIESQNRSKEYESFFTWADGKGYDASGRQIAPNNWISPNNKPAWTFNEARGQFYLSQFAEGTADLNFANKDVVKHFEEVLTKWMEAGAAGVRLRHARYLFFAPPDGQFPDEIAAAARDAAGADHGMHRFWRHAHTRDLPSLAPLLQRWQLTVASHAPAHADKPLLSVAEEGEAASAAAWALCARAPLQLAALPRLARALQLAPALQLNSNDSEAALFSLMLPATPVLDILQLTGNDSETGISRLVSLRAAPGFAGGRWQLEQVNCTDAEPIIGIVRWKQDQSAAHVGLYNQHEAAAHAALDPAWAPLHLNVYHASQNTLGAANYTINAQVSSDNVLVPAKSTVVLSFVPKTAAEK